MNRQDFHFIYCKTSLNYDFTCCGRFFPFRRICLVPITIFILVPSFCIVASKIRYGNAFMCKTVRISPHKALKLSKVRIEIVFSKLPVLIIPFSCGFILNPVELVIPLTGGLILIPALVVVIWPKNSFYFFVSVLS